VRVLAVMIAGALAATGGSAGAQAQASATAPVMVFFDWGKDEVRRDDEGVLDTVAEAWRAKPSAHLLLTGHTDRSGNAAFNRQAGLARARTIRGGLEKRGIPRNAMSLASFGEERPLVPTEDGVREVQNRRVEIAFEE